MKDTRATFPDSRVKGINPEDVQMPETQFGQESALPTDEEEITDLRSEMAYAIFLLPEQSEKLIDLYVRTVTAQDGMTMEDILDEMEPDSDLSVKVMHHIAEHFRSVLAGQKKKHRRKMAADMMTCLYRRQDDETNGGGIYAALAAISRRRQADTSRELGEKIMAERNPNYQRERKQQK